MSHDPVDDLRKEIAKGRVLAIVGAGISIGATKNAPTASWTGLLENGVDRCVAVAQPLVDGWAERVRAEIHSGDMDDLLSAAEKVSRKLGFPNGGNYRAWLRDAVGTLHAEDRSVLEALRDLGIPLATTNYDGLLEEVTGLPAVTWREGAKVEWMIRGDEKGVLHFHGYWDQSESVVLGIRSYQEILGDSHAQNVLKTLRTVNTLLFVGCGEGLADPNFGALLEWTREVFAGSGYSHYRLCRESEAPDLRKLHPKEERIIVLSYGPNHSELASFLQTLRPASTPKPEKKKKKEEELSPERRAPRLPAPPRCFGRTDQVEDLVATLCTDSPPPTPILGPPGVGKTTITLTALHDRRVVQKFGARRYFVRCDSAKSRHALIGEIATSLHLEPGPDLEDRLFMDLERPPAVLALDNAETPWEADMVTVEEFLTQLTAISGLALVVSLRGEQRPFGPTWREAIRVGPLDLESARKAFLTLAGDRHRNDPDLNRLLEAVDRLPLAVTLLAHQAEGQPDLSSLWKQWQEKRTTILRRADGKERLSNLEVSLELSIQGRRMTEPARRLLSLLGILPDGIASEDLNAVLPGEGEAAAALLRRVGLAIAGDSRLRVLAPIREHVGRQHPPESEASSLIINHYLILAKLGKRAGAEGGAEAIERLSPEIENLAAIVLRGLKEINPIPAIEAAVALEPFYRLTGLGTVGLLECAQNVARQIGNKELEAACIQSLGDIALDRSEHNDARERFQDALTLYQHVSSLLGQANCIKRLGDIALRRSEHDDARGRFQEALTLYQDVGDLLGKANCIQSLGDIALRCPEHDNARERFQDALTLYQRVGSLLGQANCTQRLGAIALRQFEHDDARERLQEALTLYQRVGDLLGQANCIQSFGDIALDRSEHDNAREKFQEALTLYQRVGSLLGQANCIQSLGDIALRQSGHGDARERFQEALTLYKRVGDLLGQANCIQRLGDISLRQSRHDDARERFQEALALYQRVGSLLGQANCIQNLGDIALRRFDREAARERFQEALALYERIPDPYSSGWARVRLARITHWPKEQRQHLETVREAWTRIKRPDLVEELDKEFGSQGS